MSWLLGKTCLGKKGRLAARGLRVEAGRNRLSFRRRPKALGGVAMKSLLRLRVVGILLLLSACLLGQDDLRQNFMNLGN